MASRRKVKKEAKKLWKKEFGNWIPSKNISTRYAKTKINEKYYSTINSDGFNPSLPPAKYLSEEEWKDKKQGIVFLDHKTNKLVFHPEYNENPPKLTNDNGN